MQADYLDPLLDVVRKNGGSVYPRTASSDACSSVVLMIDVKVTPQQTAEQSFDIVHSVLKSYAGMLLCLCVQAGRISPSMVRCPDGGPSFQCIAAGASTERTSILC